MPTYYTLNRNMLLPSTQGHCIGFYKDTPSFVPVCMQAEVEALGAVLVEDGEGLEKPEVPEPPLGGEGLKAPPADGKERELAMRMAIETLTLRNHREDFTAGGMPTLKALNDELGWMPIAKERDIVMANMSKGG